ncbi:hypothetical protein AK830_g4563 [Neonectria ditissima]|uniref:Uncharacterized protein n=1 Tax=Neonectria ditissima TaxID=78410 RepID=A0A0P7BN41_9HYPO|nr:hypothetical protein AK830_g4563 [Neonectria ditissima]
MTASATMGLGARISGVIQAGMMGPNNPRFASVSTTVLIRRLWIGSHDVKFAVVVANNLGKAPVPPGKSRRQPSLTPSSKKRPQSPLPHPATQMSGRRQNRGQGVPSQYPAGTQGVGGGFYYVDEQGQTVFVQGDAASYPGPNYPGQVYEAAPPSSGSARRASDTTSRYEVDPNAQGSAARSFRGHRSRRLQPASSSSARANSGVWAYGSGGSQSISPSSTTPNWGSLDSNQPSPPDDTGSRIRATGESLDTYNWHMNHFMTTPTGSVQVRHHSGPVPVPDSVGRIDRLFPRNLDHGDFGQYPGNVEISSSDTDEGYGAVGESQNGSKSKSKSRSRSSRSSKK